jgi:hypothetical protein
MNIGFCAKPDQTNAKAMVEKASENFVRLNSFHMQIDGKASTVVQGKIFNVLVQGDCDVQLKPMLWKNVINMTMNLDSTSKDQKITQYLQQDAEQWVVYSNLDGHWVKQVMPKQGPLYDPQLSKNYYQEIKSVIPIKSTDKPIPCMTMLLYLSGRPFFTKIPTNPPAIIAPAFTKVPTPIINLPPNIYRLQ